MGDRIFIVHVCRKKFTENKFSEKFLSWLSNFYHVLVFALTTEVFEGKINRQQILL